MWFMKGSAWQTFRNFMWLFVMVSCYIIKQAILIYFTLKLNHLGRNLETKSIHTRRNLFTIKDFYIFDQKQIRFQFNTPKNTLWGISTLHLIVWNAFLMIKMFQSHRSIMKNIWPKVLIQKSLSQNCLLQN